MTTGANGSGGTTAADDTDERVPPGALLAEEMRQLLDALADRTQPWLSRMSGVDGSTGGEQPAHTPATCGWCPLCAGLAVLRGERPELAVRAAEHAAGLLSVLRSALADHTPPPRSAHPWDQRGPVQPDQDQGEDVAPDSGRVQHITVRRRGERAGSGHNSGDDRAENRGDDRTGDHDGDGTC